MSSLKNLPSVGVARSKLSSQAWCVWRRWSKNLCVSLRVSSVRCCSPLRGLSLRTGGLDGGIDVMKHMLSAGCVQRPPPPPPLLLLHANTSSPFFFLSSPLTIKHNETISTSWLSPSPPLAVTPRVGGILRPNFTPHSAPSAQCDSQCNVTETKS